LTDTRDVAEFAVANRAAHEVFVRLVFQLVSKRDPTQYSPELLDQLTDSFESDRYHVRNLWANIAATVAGWNPSLDQLSPSQVSAK
jgi:hypothetical protein